MNFFKSIFTCFEKFACFSGRARRSEFYYFYLFTTIISWLLRIAVGRALFVYYLLYLPFMIPTIAVTCRRLHDIGKSGWWWFLNEIPILGTIILLVMLAEDSYPVSNDYGPNPKAPD